MASGEIDPPTAQRDLETMERRTVVASPGGLATFHSTAPWRRARMAAAGAVIGLPWTLLGLAGAADDIAPQLLSDDRAPCAIVDASLHLFSQFRPSCSPAD